MEKFRREIAPNIAKRNAIYRNLKSFADFNILIESWEQTVQDRAKLRCLIRKGEAEYEAEIVCETEGKR